MSRWVTDTHALLWHLYEDKKLSARAKDIFTRADTGDYQIIIPAIVLVEIIYLAEKGRIAVNAVNHILTLLQSGAGNYVVADLNLSVATILRTVDRSLVPDMPDRIIAATALHLNLPLLTYDRQISSLPSLSIVW